MNRDIVGSMPETKKVEFTPAMAILAAGALVAIAILFTNYFPGPGASAQQVDTAPTPTVAANVPPVSAADHIVGSVTAPIALIEYSDFQCPYCSMVYPTLKRIVEESNGQIAWVHRNLPLESIHPQARPAALAAECVADELGNDAFWSFTDAVMNNQSKMSPAYYATIAAQLGANEQTFASCVSTEKFGTKIDTESADAQASGGLGTPFTIVAGNGIQVPVSGALPYAQFKAVIQAVQSRQ